MFVIKYKSWIYQGRIWKLSKFIDGISSHKILFIRARSII